MNQDRDKSQKPYNANNYVNEDKQYDFTLAIKDETYDEDLCRANIRSRFNDYRNVIIAPTPFKEKVIVPPTDFI